jgi:hypothetical protein
MPSLLSTLRIPSLPPLPWTLTAAPFNFNFTTSNRPLLLGLALPPALYILTSLPGLISSYRDFIAVGPGGLPYNVWGFLIQCCMRVVARGDVRAVPPPYYHRQRTSSGGSGKRFDGVVDELVVDPAVVEAYAPHGQNSFLGLGLGLGAQAGSGDGDDKTGLENVKEVAGGGHERVNSPGFLPLRKPPRPSIPNLVAPQRQLSMQGTPDTISRMQLFLQNLVEANASVLEMRPSGLEGKAHQAVFLRDAEEVPVYMGMAKGEIVHVHPEGSSHMTVSLVDGEEAIVKGW